jgi:hypothetical protein
MSWTIDIDHFNDATDTDYYRVGTQGYGLTVNQDTIGSKRFHIRDDDKNVYFSGWLVEDDLCITGMDAWESALEFGAADMGATEILDGMWRVIIG